MRRQRQQLTTLILFAGIVFAFGTAAVLYADTGPANARTTDYFVKERSAIALSWLGASQFLPMQGERATCDVSRKWIERYLFPEFASGVNSWDLTPKLVNANQIVCQPSLLRYRSDNSGGV